MDVSTELTIVIKTIIAFLLVGVIGLDRERHGRDAGIRTYAEICIGTAIAAHLVNVVAATLRVVANIVIGIGFLGAGIIYRNGDSGSFHGLTPAATVWFTSAVSVVVGLNMYIIA